MRAPPFFFEKIYVSTRLLARHFFFQWRSTSASVSMKTLYELASRIAWVVFCALFAAFTSQVAASILEWGAPSKTSSAHLDTVEAMLEQPGQADLWRDLGGYAEQVKALRRGVVRPLAYPHLFFAAQAPSLRPAQGVLLHGPPGTGKTSFVRACAAEAKVPMLCFTAAVLEQKWYGESPKILAAAFELARQRAPAIVFIDEVDSFGRQRSEMDQACVYTMKCELLRHMDALSGSESGVIAVACTNCVDALDPALRRRFPLQIEIGRPNREERASILQAIVRGERVGRGVLRRIVDASEGETGAQLRERFRAACAQRLERATEGVLDATDDPGELVRRLGRLTVRDWSL